MPHAWKCELNAWRDSSVGYSVWTEFSGCGFKCHSGQLSIAASKNPSVVNTYIFNIYIYVHIYLIYIYNIYMVYIFYVYMYIFIYIYIYIYTYISIYLYVYIYIYIYMLYIYIPIIYLKQPILLKSIRNTNFIVID